MPSIPLPFTIMRNDKPTYQELVNLVQFLSHRIDMLDKLPDLYLNKREKEVIAFCEKNRDYNESA